MPCNTGYYGRDDDIIPSYLQLVHRHSDIIIVTMPPTESAVKGGRSFPTYPGKHALSSYLSVSYVRILALALDHVTSKRAVCL